MPTSSRSSPTAREVSAGRWRELANRGFAIVVGYLTDRRAADATVDEVLAAGGAALTIRADVGDELDVERMFTEATEAFGGVDVVVHATGDGVLARVGDGDVDRFDAVQHAIVRGTFLVNRQATRQVRDGGTIVNLPASSPTRRCRAMPAPRRATPRWKR